MGNHTWLFKLVVCHLLRTNKINNVFNVKSNDKSGMNVELDTVQLFNDTLNRIHTMRMCALFITFEHLA